MSALRCCFYEGNEYFCRPMQQQRFIRMFICVFIIDEILEIGRNRIRRAARVSDNNESLV